MASYDRLRAVQYAQRYWNSYNPYYRKFEDDCTNFISQCLYAGGIPMQISSDRGKGWWYRKGHRGKDDWSYSWTVAHSLYLYLQKGHSPGLRTQLMQSPYQLQLGDIICYDWEGDGRWNHQVIITGFAASGDPLVNAHTYNSRDRYWLYRSSPAWTTKTRYAFFHIL